MSKITPVLIANISIALFFLVYLCGLSLWSVLIANQQPSLTSTFNLLIVLMPFLGVLATYILARHRFSLQKNDYFVFSFPGRYEHVGVRGAFMGSDRISHDDWWGILRVLNIV